MVASLHGLILISTDLGLYMPRLTELGLNGISLLLLLMMESCGHVFYGLKWVVVGAENSTDSECFDVTQTAFKVTCFVDSLLIIILSLWRHLNH